MKTKIKILLFVFFISSNFYGQLLNVNLGDARGLFFSLGVGPRFAVGDFSSNHFFASGFEGIISYGDNESLPFFVYGKLNFASFPAEFVNILNKPSFEVYSRIYSLEPGVRYYFSPVSKEVVLLMPFVEGGLNLAVIHTVNQATTGYKVQFSNDEMKFGFHAGVGMSMFLLDALITYNYFYAYQFLGFTLRVRIPIFIKI